ncbi:Mu-like prophage I protein [Cohaesibacter sp. ES.047]|uniref:phage protease n=1 Tax=Cohaesibacter sp. ES.047 TaxID=1798205 RepID=UPI000BB8419C|nr:phage protease [Cohaesibacter sp. ES.047]SNY91387.1 Mu-like prophage I protein [Cohaesibacter sp. ES.047]
MNQTAHIFRTHCALQLGADAQVPEWVEVIPAGTITGRDDRVFINDRPELIVAQFAADGIDLIFDYEHLSEVDLEAKKPVPAAGWISALEERKGAVWARVDWTAKAREMIAAREYRYFSPALLLDQDAVPGVQVHVVGLSSAGLVHSPFLRSAALNSKQPTTPKPENSEVAMKGDKRVALCQKLKLADEASDDAVISAIAVLQAEAEKAAQFDQSNFVPKADYEQVKSKLDTLQAGEADKLKLEAEAAVDEAIKDQKVAPASKDYHLEACATRKGLDQFKALMGTTGKLAITQQTDLDKKTPQAGKVETLSVNQKQIAKQMGLSDKAYLDRLNDKEA